MALRMLALGVLAEKVLGLVLSDSRLTKLRPRRCQGREPCFARRYRNFKEWHKAPHPTLATLSRSHCRGSCKSWLRLQADRKVTDRESTGLDARGRAQKSLLHVVRAWLLGEACDQQCLANPDCVSWQVCVAWQQL